MNDKANTLKQCGLRAAMVNILKRGFSDREGPVMRLQGLGTRRRPCASRLNTHMGAPCLGTGVPAVCCGSGGGHCKADCATCRRGGWLPLVSSPYIPMLTYISLLLLIQLKTTLLRFDSLTRLPPGELLPVDRSASSAYTEKNYAIFLWIYMKHWNVTLPTTTTKVTAAGVIVRFQQSFLVVIISDCCCLFPL